MSHEPHSIRSGAKAMTTTDTAGKAATILKIRGMSCQGCVKSVERGLSAHAGVDSVQVDLQNGRATVRGSADPAELVRVVDDLGYEAEVERPG
jgi:copper chaperone CopZ